MPALKKPHIILIVAFVNILCLLIIIKSRNITVSYDFSPSDFSVSSSEVFIKESATADDSVPGSSRAVLSPDFTLPRGVYSVNMSYNLTLPKGWKGKNLSQAVSNSPESYLIEGYESRISDNLNSLTYTFRVREKSQLHIENTVIDGKGVSLSLLYMNVSYMRLRSIMHDVVSCAFWLALFDTGVFIFLFKIGLCLFFCKNCCSLFMLLP